MKRVAGLFILMIVLLSMNALTASADLNGLRITPVFDELQTDWSKNHFDLKLTNQDRLKLQFRVENPTNKDKELYVFGGNAVSTSNGEINIVKHEEVSANDIIDDTYKLANSIQVKQQYLIPQKSSVIVDVIVKTPSIKKDAYLGGVIFQDKDVVTSTQSTDENADVSFSIGNVFRETFAIHMNFSDTSNIKTDLSIKDITVVSKFNKKYVQFNLINNLGKLEKIDNLTFVLKNNGKEVATSTFSPFKIAPKNTVAMEMELPDYFTEGDLTIDMNYKGVSGDGSISIIHKVSNKEDESKDSNISRVHEEIAKSIKTETISLHWLWLLLILLILIVYISYRLGKRNNALVEEVNNEIEDKNDIA